MGTSTLSWSDLCRPELTQRLGGMGTRLKGMPEMDFQTFT